MQSLFLKSLMLAGVLACSHAAAADKPDYKVGDRLPQRSAPAAGEYKELPWDALIPPDWNPAKDLAGLDLSKLDDADPRATRALEKLRAAWDNAPIVGALNGTRVRIGGFMVPLDGLRGQVTEFLLVPYFGACIHTPPPPANQIIHVVPAKPFKTDQAMDAVWVSGVLQTTRSTTGMGSAGYVMKADVVAPFRK